MHKNFGILNHVSLLASYNFDGFSAEIFVNSFHHFPHTFSTRFSPLVNRSFSGFLIGVISVISVISVIGIIGVIRIISIIFFPITPIAPIILIISYTPINKKSHPLRRRPLSMRVKNYFTTPAIIFSAMAR